MNDSFTNKSLTFFEALRNISDTCGEQVLSCEFKNVICLIISQSHKVMGQNIPLIWLATTACHRKRFSLLAD
jgi:hypothetical protein